MSPIDVTELGIVTETIFVYAKALVPIDVALESIVKVPPQPPPFVTKPAVIV